MLFALYRVITFIIYALMFPLWGILALSGSVKWRNRLGRGLAETADSGFSSVREDRPLLWAHAASAGEALALALVVRAFCKRWPGARFIVSVMTGNGYDTAREALAELVDSGTVTVRFLPLDAPQAIRKTLKRVRPDIFLFTETEIWPNWAAALVARGIPYGLLNARLTERSRRRYSHAPSLIRHVMANYCSVICQSAEHVARFAELGVPAERIVLAGNLKTDAPFVALSTERKAELRQKLGARETDFLLICGSIRSGEFDGALGAYQSLRKRYPQLRLALAPRHLERCAAIAAEAQRLGLATSMFSSDTAGSEAVTIVDVFGILRELYGAADLAFVGGTMVPIGGHNILEPPQVGTPALFGPQTANITEAVALALEQNCALQVSDWPDFETQVERGLRGELKFGKWVAALSGAESPVRISVEAVESLLTEKNLPEVTTG